MELIYLTFDEYEKWTIFKVFLWSWWSQTYILNKNFLIDNDIIKCLQNEPIDLLKPIYVCYIQMQHGAKILPIFNVLCFQIV
jgi:hypothetical protein